MKLPDNDPWQDIYAACLGLLPESPDTDVLGAGYLPLDLRFEDFVTVNRVEAQCSLEDLLSRLNAADRLTPRELSMIHLAYGSRGSSAIRSETKAMPDPAFAKFDAGPNVVVVCSPNSVDDLALLWNLRGAHGDFRPTAPDRSAPLGSHN
ncbi:hypothetical protein [Hoyosella subflava]|uniref:Uncharacterized protein n=1 Tax=Hoyosella subflava (strain DSM 45089 / JCM 17490 / NBRC 109087 / DQS3-9A1) TaxID=443218 RepID=F6ESE3_HOYSD|nr:hypothetical protein [Hoyosella subflava]AEF43064.1 hypothetical protein AS9A_P20020 [Hoyosella subflava DQS3-9A1]